MQQIIVVIISSSVIGGIIVALLNWYRAEHTARKEHKIKILDEQIRNLYGRLYYLISQNERLFDLYNRCHAAYNEEHSIKDPKSFLEKANEYIHEIYKNNKKIKILIDSNSSLIDTDDNELFLLFYEHYTRLMIEVDEEGKSLLPHSIAKKLGVISILKPEVIDGIKKKFIEKKEQLDSLRGKLKREDDSVKKGGKNMKTWMKYLIIGWSIVSVVVVLISFQIMREDIIEEEYYIPLPELLQTKIKEAKQDGYNDQEIVDFLLNQLEELITQKKLSPTEEELNALLKTKEIQVRFQRNVEPILYIVLPIYAFLIWALPILVFSLIGTIFTRRD